MAKEKIKVDYHKLDVEKLAELVAELGDKAKDFNANEYVAERAAKTALVDVYNEDGKPKTYIDKKGRMKIKKQKVTVGTETEKYFNLLKAKRDFYKLYKDEFDWYNTPKVSEKKDKSDKVKSALASMGVKLK